MHRYDRAQELCFYTRCKHAVVGKGFHDTVELAEHLKDAHGWDDSTLDFSFLDRNATPPCSRDNLAHEVPGGRLAANPGRLTCDNKSIPGSGAPHLAPTVETAVLHLLADSEEEQWRSDPSTLFKESCLFPPWLSSSSDQVEFLASASHNINQSLAPYSRKQPTTINDGTFERPITVVDDESTEETTCPVVQHSSSYRLPSTQTYSCQFCAKTFKRRTLRDNHVRTHTNERPFRCSVEGCDQAFKQKNEQTRHETTVHGSHTRFHCGGIRPDGLPWGCGGRFARSDGLLEHYTKTRKGQQCIAARDAP